MTYNTVAAKGKSLKFEMHTVRRDNNSNLKFKGRVCGRVDSRTLHPSDAYWTELTIYVTAKGKYVGEKKELTIVEGSKNSFNGEVFEDIVDLTEFFGFDESAKDLYLSAGLESDYFIG